MSIKGDAYFLYFSDHLFEVAVEVNFLVAPEENWDHLVRSLLISVKSLVSSHEQ